MHFGLSSEQTMLQEMVSRFLAANFDLEALKGLLGKPCPEELWGEFAELGATGILVPESLGGSELSLLDAVVVAEAVGRMAAPIPYLGNVFVAPAVLALAGSDEDKDQHLPSIAAGEHRFGVDLSGWVGKRLGEPLSIDGGRIAGQTGMVVDGDDATHFLVAVGDCELAIIDRDAPGLTVESLINVDKTRTFSVLSLDNVEARTLDVEGDRETVLAVARTALAADSFGAAAHMFETARQYSLDRYQFERPIGSFQGIKHQLAQMITELEPCRSLLWYTAHTHSESPDEFPLHAAHLNSHVSEVAKYLARTSIEIHGGMGYTELLGLHLWFKRIETNRQLLGGPELTREHAASLQGWTAESGLSASTN